MNGLASLERCRKSGILLVIKSRIVFVAFFINFSADIIVSGSAVGVNAMTHR